MKCVSCVSLAQAGQSPVYATTERMGQGTQRQTCQSNLRQVVELAIGTTPDNVVMWHPSPRRDNGFSLADVTERIGMSRVTWGVARGNGCVA